MVRIQLSSVYFVFVRLFFVLFCFWLGIYLFMALPFPLFLSSPFLSLLFWCAINVNFHVCARFHRGFFVGGGGGELFRNSEIDIKHTFLGGSGGMPPPEMF